MKNFFEKIHVFLFGTAILLLVQPQITLGNSASPQMDDNTSVFDRINATEIKSSAPDKADINKGQEHSSSQFFDKYVSGRLQIGTRSTYRFLSDADSGHKGGRYGSGTFLGTIYALDEKQSVAPIYPHVTWFFLNYVGIELAYDHVEAETVATSGYDMNDKTDGSLKLSGPVVSLVARYPNETKFTPWIGIGKFFSSASFSPSPDWTHSKAYPTAYNEMIVNDVDGTVFSIGVDWNFNENWVLNLSFQSMSADIKAVYNGFLDGRQYTEQPGHFPMDNNSVRIGICYQF